MAHTMLVIVWHVLANENDCVDLGADYFARRDADSGGASDPGGARRLTTELLGTDIGLTPDR